VFGWAAVVVACATNEPPRFETDVPDPNRTRRPAAIAIDRVTELPRAASRAETQEGLVVLKAPPDLEAAKLMVERFFEAVADEDITALSALVSSDAVVLTGKTRIDALDFWRQRFDRLDYSSQAAGAPMADLPLQTVADVDRRGARELGLQAMPDSDDVIVRADLAPPKLGSTRFFGDQIVFVLEVSQDRYRIMEMAESFELSGR
jgi:hypothetical protein